MTSIIKLTLDDRKNEQEIEFNLNKFSKILDVDYDSINKQIILYILIDSDVKETKDVKLIIYAINQKMNENIKVDYIGNFVKHDLKHFIFEKIN